MTPTTEHVGMKIDNFEKCKTDEIIVEIHNNSKIKINSKLHCLRKRKTQEIQIEPKISQIPTPVYLSCPLRQTSRKIK